MATTSRRRHLNGMTLVKGQCIAQTRDVIAVRGEERYRPGDRCKGGRWRMDYDVDVTELEKVCRVFVSDETSCIMFWCS